MLMGIVRKHYNPLTSVWRINLISQWRVRNKSLSSDICLIFQWLRRMGSTGGGSHPYKEGGGGDQEVFVLTWNDFHTQFVSSFQEMRSEGDFLDTTVACSSGENHQLPVRWFRIATATPLWKGGEKYQLLWKLVQGKLLKLFQIDYPDPTYLCNRHGVSSYGWKIAKRFQEHDWHLRLKRGFNFDKKSARINKKQRFFSEKQLFTSNL